MINLDRVHGVTLSMVADQAMAAVKARAPAPPRARHRRPGGESKPFEGDAREIEEKDRGLRGASAGDYVD